MPGWTGTLCCEHPIKQPSRSEQKQGEFIACPWHRAQFLNEYLIEKVRDKYQAPRAINIH